MKFKASLVLLGIGLGVAAPLPKRSLRPLSVYALTGGMIAYEAVCGLAESSGDMVNKSLQKVRHILHREMPARNQGEASPSESC